MNKYKEKIGDILNKVKGNKRVLYLTFCTILILFCLALNVTFAKYITKTNNQGTNITIGNMSYLFEINKDFPDLKSDIYNDRIIKLKTNTTQRYYVSITAQNKYASKYELNYRACASYDEKTNTCIYADSLPENVKVAYAYNSPSPVKGNIDKDETRIITLYTKNETTDDIYLELTMNAGYIHNELKTLDNNYNTISEVFENPEQTSIEIKSIIAYANGEEVESYEFPSHGNFSLKMTCYDKDGNESTTAHADGYWSGTKWVVNVNSATENTICYAKFTTTTTPIPNFQYLVNGTDVSADSAYVKTINDGNGNWRIKFFESGTFIMSYPDINYIDVFVVGGGGGGGGSMANCGTGGSGGAGGYAKTCRFSDENNTQLITITKNTNYVINIGAGGAYGPYIQTNDIPNTIYGGTGGASSGFNCSAAGGTGGYPCGTYGSKGARGGNGGSGGGGGSHDGTIGGEGGSNGANGINSSTYSSGHLYWGHLGGSGQGSTTREFGESTGELYAGGGGGGPNASGGAGGGAKGSGGSASKNTGGGGGGSAGGGSAGGSGGSGIVIIRNHRV